MLQQGHYIRALALIGLDEIVAEAGGDMPSFLAEAGLPESVLKNVDLLISFRAMLGLIERVALALDMPDIGLRWTLRMEPHHTNAGPLLAISRFTRTTRDWMEDALSYWAYHTNAFTLELLSASDGNNSIFRIKNAAVSLMSRHFTEHVLANIICMVRTASNHSEDNPAVVRFCHRRPKSIAFHEAIFRCPVEFDCEYNEIEFNSNILDYEMLGALSPLRSIVRRYVQYRIDRLEFYDAAISTNVALAITSMIGTGQTDLGSIAESLMVHPKKLQRLLRAEGISYNEILEDVRKSLSNNMIEDSVAPVSQIAGLLGYSTTAPFTTAFRRWTGRSPLQWRKQHKGDAIPRITDYDP